VRRWGSEASTPRGQGHGWGWGGHRYKTRRDGPQMPTRSKSESARNKQTSTVQAQNGVAPGRPTTSAQRSWANTTDLGTRDQVKAPIPRYDLNCRRRICLTWFLRVPVKIRSCYPGRAPRASATDGAGCRWPICVPVLSTGDRHAVSKARPTTGLTHGIPILNRPRAQKQNIILCIATSAPA
jgi:hypothetical protein